MEAEFERAERRREKERKEAERQRKLREEQERKAKQIVAEAERKRLAIQEQQRMKDQKRRQREEEEALQNGGIQFSQFYRPIPLPSLETDKIRLPPSALEALSSAGAIDANRVLAFELALFDDANEAIVSKTNCGVLEFTAAEGTVEVPVKAAMSLTKHLGESALGRFRVRVRYISIDRYEKIRASVQPLGQGFHVDGVEQVNVDLKSILERVLSQQTIISEGDWIPIRHEGRTYVLGVRELWPDSQVALINTDVEIDIMPSEEFEKEIKNKVAQEQQREARAERAKRVLASLPLEPSGMDAVTIRARLPDSLTGTRKFERNTKLGMLFDWAEALLGDRDPPARTSGLEIVQVIRPGESNILSWDKRDLTLASAGFGRVENLNFRWRVDETAMEVVEEEEKSSERRSASSDASEEWVATKATAESTLDRDLLKASKREEMDESVTPSSEAVEQSQTMTSTEMFHLLISRGADPPAAAKVCQRYPQAVHGLIALNVLESPVSGAKAVELIEKFKGSSERIADAMFTWIAESSQSPAQVPNNTERWTEQIAILQSMFTDRARGDLLSVLDKHGGSVQMAVNELLS